LGIEEGEIHPSDHALSVTDNSTAESWIPKSNFDESPDSDSDQAAHAATAQWLGTTGIDNNLCLSGCWFMGLLNVIADPLSRDHLSSDAALTKFLLHKYPQQVPSTFKISSLPEKITSAILYLLQTETPEMEQLPVLIAKPTPPGSDGSSSSPYAASSTTHSSTASPSTAESECSKPSPKPSGNANGASPLKDMIAWLAAHAKPPSIMWERPSPQPADLTQDATAMANLFHFYNGSLGDMPITTPAPNHRKRSHGL